MRIRRFAMVAIAAVLLAPLFHGRAAPTQAQIVNLPYAVASETYYTADTANGHLAVRVHAEYQNTQSPDLQSVRVWLMPGAQNLVVTADGQALTTKITDGSEAEGRSGFAETTLPRPLKSNTRITLEATYEVGPRSGGRLMTLEPGLIETPFIGQGPGSFVLVDVPKEGDNYFDPGCLLATEQPGDVKSAGRERWVCGEVTIIAVNGDDPDVLRRCASMDDRCRQRGLITTFSAYMQSVTDLSKLGRLEGAVTMPDGDTVQLALKYFKRDQAWADKQWAIATQAFPLLAGLFGWPYERDQVVMRQSHHLEFIGAAGLALDGEVLLSTGTGFDEEVTVHELAHMWMGYNLDTKWLWEGLAEYGTKVVAPQLGITLYNRNWRSVPVNEPLATWLNGSSVYDPDYWYGKAGDFWMAYEAAVGGREVMTQVLSRMDDEQSLWPLKAGWFMDHGEWVSGKNLDALFLEWVFNPLTATKLLAERRAAHDAVKELQARAATLNLYGMPSDIYDNLLAWVFDPVAGQVEKANKVLDSYQQVVTLSNEAGLGAPEGVAKAWGSKKVSETQVVVEEQRQAIAAILQAAKDLASEPEDSPALKLLAEAKDKYAAGDYSGAKASAAAGVTARFNADAAVKMIEIAKKKQDEFSPNFFGRIGMFFTEPDKELADAEKALADGDGTRALKLSRSAYDTWDSATQRGIQRLAMLAGLMCALTFAVWFILHRLEGPSAPKRATAGHYLEEPGERRSSWRDWENTP